MKQALGVWLRLGRVSNLPTVWSNTLAAQAVAQPHAFTLQPAVCLPLLLGMSAAYTGGMFLNDAFDRNIDARERPERPIPSGQVSAKSVFLAGFALLALGIAANAWAAHAAGTSLGTSLALSSLLSLTIVIYDVYHKSNPLSPVVMGACRALVYVTAGYAVSAAPSTGLFVASFGLACHVVGLTFAAKHEARNEVRRFWPFAMLGATPLLGTTYFSPLEVVSLLACSALVVWVAHCLRWLLLREIRSVPKAVVGLIAGISLLDGFICAASGSLTLVAACLLCFALTRVAQRVIPGT
jgi:hypothetical protein